MMAASQHSATNLEVFCSTGYVMHVRTTVSRVLRAPFDPRTWRETLHLVLGAPLGAAAAVYLFVAGFSIVFGVTVVGLLVLATVLRGTRVFGVVDRGRVRVFLGGDVPTPPLRQRHLPGLIGWAWGGLTDRVCWRLLLYVLLAAPTGLLLGYVTVLLWAESLLALISPLRDQLGDPARYAGPFLQYWHPPPLVASIIGLLALLATPWIVRGLAGLDRRRIVGMLSWAQRPERVEAAERRRDQAVDSAAAQLRRIERDLHDGAQARMVALAMELGRAREEIGEHGDLRQTARRIAAAHDEAKLALADLRDLAHGIYPAVLTDLGLDGAVQMLTARCSLLVTADLQIPERPDPVIETTAYLCIAELLTNITKHAGATAATVRVRRSTTPPGDGPPPSDRLRIEISDDGAGGAVATPSGGLAGLTDRAESVGGRLEISSPDGGPTLVTVELPCAS